MNITIKQKTYSIPSSQSEIIDEMKVSLELCCDMLDFLFEETKGELNNVNKRKRELIDQLTQNDQLQKAENSLVLHKDFIDTFQFIQHTLIHQFEQKRSRISSKLLEINKKKLDMNPADSECQQKMKELSSEIIETERVSIDMLEDEYVEWLEDTIGMKCGDILFDSNIDNWSMHTSVFNQRIIGKQHITVVVKNVNGEIFGFYNHGIVDFEENNNDQQDNIHSFLFNLKSNGRFLGPIKFEENQYDENENRYYGNKIELERDI